MLGCLQQIDEETKADASVGVSNSSKDVQISDACPVKQSEKHGVDLFRIEENDPSKSNAMRTLLELL